MAFATFNGLTRTDKVKTKTETKTKTKTKTKTRQDKTRQDKIRPIASIPKGTRRAKIPYTNGLTR